MIVEIQCLPTPAGTEADRYAHVDAAIAAVAAAGVPYEVGPLGTSFEAPPDRAWAVARAAHEACLQAGAASVVTVVKVAEGTPSIDALVGKHRRGSGR